MNDLDPILREAMTRVRGPIEARPSLSDVRRRARRRNRRRMAVTAGVVACTGVATTALIIRRDSAGPSAAGQSDRTDAPVATTIYQPGANQTTTTTYGLPTMTITSSSVWDALWNARYDPAGAALAIEPADQAAADVMPTPEQFGCTSAECRAMYNYVIWHEIAGELGFFDVSAMQTFNPAIDFSQPPREGDVLQSAYSSLVSPTTSNLYTTTTFGIFEGILLIDGGAPAGAMDDAMQRLTGFNPTIVAGTGKSVGQSMLMPIADHDMIAQSVGIVLGLDGFDTWDPSWVADPISGTVAVVIGPDYWDRVQQAPSQTTTTTSTTLLATTTSNP